MNRQQRRAMHAPVEENQHVKVELAHDLVKLQMIGVTSKIAVHVYLSPKLSLKLGWALIKSAYKAWRV